MKIQKSQVSKLYYKKWPYKICCYVPGAYSIKMALFNNNVRLHRLYNYSDKPKTLAVMTKFQKAFEPFLHEDLQCRAEGSHFNIFCKSPTLLEQLKKAMNEWITVIHQPVDNLELQYMLDNGHKKRICDTYPKNKYKYRIFFKPSMPQELKSKFLKWSDQYVGDILLSPSTKNWCVSNKTYLQLPFMYVKDGPQLTMVNLFLGDNIKSIEEFILRSSINTLVEEN